jgi:hypothetical protein
METINRLLSLTVMSVGLTVMLGYIVTIADYVRLSFNARGTVGQIEARKGTLIGAAVLAVGFIIAVLVQFIDTKIFVSIIWPIAVIGALSGACVGLTQIIRSGYLFLTAHGNRERIAEAKSIFWHAIMGMAIIAATLVFIPR